MVPSLGTNQYSQNIKAKTDGDKEFFSMKTILMRAALKYEKMLKLKNTSDWKPWVVREKRQGELKIRLKLRSTS